MSIEILSQSDFTQRLIGLMPANWIASEDLSPGGLSYALLDSFSANDNNNYSALEQIQESLFLTTATGVQIDNIAKDFFGNTFTRNSGESDQSYISRIVSRLFLPLGTKEGLVSAIQRSLKVPNVDGSYTPVTPVILEGNSANVSGGYSDGINVYGPLAYGPQSAVPSGSAAGGLYAWQGGTFTYQALITVQQPSQYLSDGVTPNPYFMLYLDIMTLVDSVRPLATVLWVQVLGQNGAPPVGWTH